MGRRGPMPKSRALQVLHGTAPLSKEVLAEIQQEFIPPKMPSHFGKAEAEAWNTTVTLLRPMMTLREVDAAVLAAYCSAFVRWQTAEREICKFRHYGGLLTPGEGGFKANPLVIISRDAQKDMVFYAAQLGMTPASRIKMASGIGKVIEKNPFTKLKTMMK